MVPCYSPTKLRSFHPWLLEKELSRKGTFHVSRHAPTSKQSLLQPWSLAIIAIIVFSAALTADRSVHAKVQEPELSPGTTTPSAYAEFQYATLTATTNVINATNVPVVTPGGISYKNLTFTVNVAANGTITIAPGSPAVVASPANQTAGFKAGTYVAPSTVLNGTALITVSSPGNIPGGATEWTLATPKNADSCTYPSSATWYVISPTSPNNPLAARLKKAGIAYTGYSYGFIGGEVGCFPDSAWYTGSLLGLSQVGNTISIVSFSQNGTTDYSTPQDQLTFTLKQ